MEEIYKQLIEGIRKYFKENNFQHAVVGLSGGVDSACTLKLGIDALGAENLTAIIMPELNVSSEENIFHAKALAEYLGVNTYYQPINSFLIDYGLLPWKQNKKATMNTKARIRMNLLYSYANSTNALVLGTSNKSEILLGYGTKYGDLAADIELIGELFKEDVYALARFLSLPEEFITKSPSAELSPGQTDADELGDSYENLDPILIKYCEGQSADEIIEKGHKPHLVRSIFQRIEANKHKSEMPPLIEVEFSGYKRKFKARRTRSKKDKKDKDEKTEEVSEPKKLEPVKIETVKEEKAEVVEVPAPELAEPKILKAETPQEVLPKEAVETEAPPTLF